MEYLAQHIEGLIFTSPKPLSLTEIKACLDETFEMDFSRDDLKKNIVSLQKRYDDSSFSFEIVAVSGGYQFMSKGAYHQTIGTLLKQKTKKQLSRAALETLSIIAYKQPVSKAEMEKIRGVSCDYALQKLLEKELVDIQGRSEAPGRPLLYGTSDRFMDYFGLESLKDLPKPKDFKVPENMIGEEAPIEEDMLVEVEEEGIQIGNINRPPLVVEDLNGDELVVNQLSPELSHAIDVIATGVGLFSNGGTRPPRIISSPDIPPVEPAQPSSLVVVDMNGGALVVPELNGIMGRVVDVVATGVGVFDKEDRSPKVISSMTDDDSFIQSAACPVASEQSSIDFVVSTIIAGAVIFDK